LAARYSRRFCPAEPSTNGYRKEPGEAGMAQLP
jgi:hypothetical protein